LRCPSTLLKCQKAGKGYETIYVAGTATAKGRTTRKSLGRMGYTLLKYMYDANKCNLGLDIQVECEKIKLKTNFNI